MVGSCGSQGRSCAIERAGAIAPEHAECYRIVAYWEVSETRPQAVASDRRQVGLVRKVSASPNRRCVSVQRRCFPKRTRILFEIIALGDGDYLFVQLDLVGGGNRWDIRCADTRRHTRISLDSLNRRLSASLHAVPHG